jgi:hypothetical protein
MTISQQSDVAYWDSYAEKGSIEKNFVLTIDNQSASSGQTFLELSRKNVEDDVLDMTLEVNKLPGSDIETQCIHLAFDNSNMAVSIFKRNGTYVLRLENGVTMEHDSLGNGESIFVLRQI